MLNSIKPSLKKVSKAQAQMEKIKMFAAKANQMDHRMGLKSVKKFALEDGKEEDKKPDWAGGVEKKEKTPGDAGEEGGEEGEAAEVEVDAE